MKSLCFGPYSCVTRSVYGPSCCRCLQQWTVSLLRGPGCVCSRLWPSWGLQRLYTSPPGRVVDSRFANRETTVMSAARAKGREGSPHRHSWGVHEALVEVVQSAVRVFLGFKSHKTKLAELAVLGELQWAVRHCAEGSKHRLEPLLLHLQTRHTDSGEPTQNVTALGRWYLVSLLTPLGRFFTMSLDIVIVDSIWFNKHKTAFVRCTTYVNKRAWRVY